MNGTGFVFLDVITIFAVFFAAICHIAIYTDRSLPETQAMDAARMLMFAGNCIIGVRWAFLFGTSGWDLHTSAVLVLGVFLVSVAQIIMAADRLIHGNRKGYDDEPTTPGE